MVEMNHGDCAIKNHVVVISPDGCIVGGLRPTNPDAARSSVFWSRLRWI
jgi:hypothetical protein